MTVEKFLQLVERHNPPSTTDESVMAESVAALYEDWLNWCNKTGRKSKSKPHLMAEFVTVSRLLGFCGLSAGYMQAICACIRDFATCMREILIREGKLNLTLRGTDSQWPLRPLLAQQSALHRQYTHNAADPASLDNGKASLSPCSCSKRQQASASPSTSSLATAHG